MLKQLRRWGLPRANRGIFITGTDTGVGKTLVTAGILRWLRQNGVDVVPMKPVQTGAAREGDKLIAPDLEFCLAAAGIKPSAEEKKLMLPYAYEPACSPHLAGRLMGRYPEIPEIVRCADMLLKKRQAVIVEGAGGVLVPLNERRTMLDLMTELHYPVALVSRPGLGTINHTLLSIEALRSAGLNLLGVVFNRTGPLLAENKFIEEDNPETIAVFGDVQTLGNIRYFRKLDPEDRKIWRDFEADLTGLETILKALK